MRADVSHGDGLEGLSACEEVIGGRVTGSLPLVPLCSGWVRIGMDGRQIGRLNMKTINAALALIALCALTTIDARPSAAEFYRP